MSRNSMDRHFLPLTQLSTHQSLVVTVQSRILSPYIITTRVRTRWLPRLSIQ